jgi:putative transposase
VGYLKGKSAIMIFERFTNLRQNFRGHKFWARGYYVSTVGFDEKKVQTYIQNQEENDKIEGNEGLGNESKSFEDNE